MTASSDTIDQDDEHSTPWKPMSAERSGRPAAVVGVGASAGGLKPITALLQSVPAASGLALVVIQHRTPNNERLMVDLLVKATPLPVHTAEDGMPIEADSIYVAPAGKMLSMAQGCFVVAEPAAERAVLPIDIFFRSLASECKQSAICVVLSGSGADGTIGLASVKEAGGLVVVQDPAMAAFDGMPNSAIATGMADYVLAPERMAEALVNYVGQPYLRVVSEDDPLSGGEDLDRILDLMQARSRYDYRAYKTRTLVRRIERRMGIHQIDSMHHYREFLGTHPGEVEQLSRDILISVTRFFRDQDAFALLNETILVPLVQQCGAERPIRVWVPGCATGEEVYSIAMLLMEACAAANKACDIKVFGTDIDVRALDVARTGVYPETIAVDVSANRLDRFFTRVEAGYKVSRPLREAVTFAIQNMISDPPFSSLDLISCRNVLIYIDPTVQRSIIELFHFGLADGGSLFLGSAETIGARTDLFEPLSKKWRLYRKLGSGRRYSPALPTSVDMPAGDGRGVSHPAARQSGGDHPAGSAARLCAGRRADRPASPDPLPVRPDRRFPRPSDRGDAAGPDGDDAGRPAPEGARRHREGPGVGQAGDRRPGPPDAGRRPVPPHRDRGRRPSAAGGGKPAAGDLRPGRDAGTGAAGRRDAGIGRSLRRRTART